ncbi:MAG: HD domain-containing protein [Desulfobacterales bacterium]|nr:MAG: HD domain-containing protein [Desulfobacterales bacterium]
MIPFNSNIFPKTKGAYIIGGSIRDILLERTPSDYDIAVKGNPEEFAQEMALKRAGRVVEMGKAGQKIFRVILGQHIFDIAAINGVNIENDLKQRDFTINAMAYDLSSGEIIDCVGGLQDLDDRKIRMVSPAVFKKDPIRLIRAYRMSSCLEFDIDQHTVTAIKNEAERIKDSAGERVRVELFKILGTKKSYDYLSQMAESRLLTAMLPDLSRLQGCIQNGHHIHDVFEHTMKAYQHLETIINDIGSFMPNIAIQLQQSMDDTIAVLLKCAILLHDIGKPWVKAIDHNGHTHFYGHAKKSADMAQKISHRLSFATREIRFIDFIIRNHLRPLFLFTAHQKKTLKRTGVTRFFIKCGENTPYLLLHAMADIEAKQTGETKTDSALISFIKEIMNDFFHHFKPKSEKPRLVTGYDLIHVFALTPSPLFKTILNRIEEARLANRIHNREEALNLVKKFLNNL